MHGRVRRVPAHSPWCNEGACCASARDPRHRPVNSPPWCRPPRLRHKSGMVRKPAGDHRSWPPANSLFTTLVNMRFVQQIARIAYSPRGSPGCRSLRTALLIAVASFAVRVRQRGVAAQGAPELKCGQGTEALRMLSGCALQISACAALPPSPVLVRSATALTASSLMRSSPASQLPVVRMS